MEQKQINGTLLVTRNGYVDDEYYDAIYTAKRREVLHNAGHQALQALTHAPVAVGKGIVWLMTHDMPRTTLEQ